MWNWGEKDGGGDGTVLQVNGGEKRNVALYHLSLLYLTGAGDSLNPYSTCSQKIKGLWTASKQCAWERERERLVREKTPRWRASSHSFQLSAHISYNLLWLLWDDNNKYIYRDGLCPFKRILTWIFLTQIQPSYIQIQDPSVKVDLSIYKSKIKCLEYLLPIHQVTQNGSPKIVSWLELCL